MALIVEGPIAQYQFKYHLKATNKEDTAKYAAVEKSIKGLKGRVHREDMKEATRLILRAAFAHNTTNVISAPLASYLTRHESRFYFSHPTVYAPVKDLIKLQNKQDIGATVRYDTEGRSFFENVALHYLLRPRSMEAVCV